MAKRKVTNNVLYKYGTLAGEYNSQLRGGGLKNPLAKAYILSCGFKWVFNRGRKKVLAYESSITPHKLIEVLLHLKSLGLDVAPSTSLAPKKWLYLDLPKTFEKKLIKPNEVLFDDLIEWLDNNNYSRLRYVENPGDFSIIGELLYIWTKQDDILIRIVFDGQSIESVSKVDPETLEASFAAEFTVNGLREVEAAAITTQKAMEMYADLAISEMSAVIRKYPTARIKSMTKSFTKLDEKHPFFNMIKWDK